MIRILFVCHGNICRSPMAQFVMQHMVNQKRLNNQFVIDSAATSQEEIGNEVHYGTKCKLEQMHIPYSFHASRQLTKYDYDHYDLIIGMDNANLYNMWRILGKDDKCSTLLSFANRNKDIADPWYTGNFDATYNDVWEGCDALLNYLIEEGYVETI